jgi:hypothetical protein
VFGESAISLAEILVVGAELTIATKKAPIVMTETMKRISSGLNNDRFLKYFDVCFYVLVTLV